MTLQRWGAWAMGYGVFVAVGSLNVYIEGDSGKVPNRHLMIRVKRLPKRLYHKSSGRGGCTLLL
jgi:hypothetical protein